MKNDIRNTHISADRSNDSSWTGFYALMIVICGFLFFPFMYSRSDVNPGIALIFLTLVSLTVKRWTGAFLMAFCQILLLVFEPQSNHGGLGEFGFTWVILPLILILEVSRFRTLQERRPQSIRGILAPIASVITDAAVPRSITQNFKQAFVQTMRASLLIAGCSAFAWAVMQMVPMRDVDIGFSTIHRFSLKTSGYRLLILALSMFAIFLLIWIAVSEIIWRKLSAAQASIFLRSVIVRYYHRDFRMIILKRLKIRRARTKAILPVSASESPSATKGKS